MSRIYNCTGHELRIPHVVRADGLYLTDDAGKQYMDLESGVWCTSLGHNHPRIPDDISAFIFEPGSASGFVRFPPETVIQNIAAVVRENGGKIIANEVTTGIGRTGKWFGYQHYPVEPDMVAMGKGIGNGYPVSVTAMNASIADGLENSTFKYMQSHQNDPMGAAIVQEVIRTIIEEDLISSAEKKGHRFFKELESLIDGVCILAVRGKGLMFGMDLCDEATGNQIYQALLDKGYILCNRKGLFRIDPPLSITKEEFSRFVEDFRNILQKQEG